MKKHKILFILNNAFLIDSRVLKEATSLTNAGYDITLICKWERGLKREEIIHGFKVKRVGFDLFNKIKGLKRINIIIFWLISFVECFKKYDAVHCHDWDTLPVGALAKIISFGKMKLVYDTHEYATEQWTGQNTIRSIVKSIEWSFIGVADRVIAVSESIAEAYVKLYRINQPNLVLNCPIYTKPKKQNLFREKFGIDKDALIFLYQGVISKKRDLDLILDCFRGINDPKKVVVFLGYGADVEEVKAASMTANNIFYHEAVTPDELVNYTNSADVGLVLMQNSCLNYEYCLPNKFFQYCMSGLPVITSDLTELRKMVIPYKLGYVLEEDKVEKLINLVVDIDRSKLSNISNNCLQFAKIYNWSDQEAELSKIYSEILK